MYVFKRYHLTMIKILTLLALILLPTSAYAEETGELILPPTINVSLVHKNYMEPQQFAVFMKVPDAVSGCYDVSMMGFQTSFIEKNYLDIEVTGYKRTPIKTKNIAYDCPVGTRVITATIPLDADNLKERNIRQIRFKRGNIEDAFDVKITDGSIALTPRRTTSFKPAGQLTHNYSGGGLVRLHVPMANKGDVYDTALKNFAYGRALMPSDAGQYIFMDKSGETSAKFNESGYTELGTIHVNRPYNGGNGAQMTTIPLKVFASRPDTTL